MGEYEVVLFPVPTCPLAQISALHSKKRRICGRNAEKLRKASVSADYPQNEHLLCGESADMRRKCGIMTLRNFSVAEILT
jgi:hypothetical protein